MKVREHRSLYRTWSNMKQRCYNSKNPMYYLYGEVGISVCEEWLSNWRIFANWSYGNGYISGLSLDRINGSKGYSPDNCRWATTEVQSRNKKSNRWITAFGETKCCTDWVSDGRCSISVNCLKLRIKLGWEVERAITIPRLNGNQWSRK